MNLNECHVSVFTFAYVYKIIYVIIYIYSYVCVYIYICVCVCGTPKKICVCVFCYYTTLAVGSASQVDLRWPCAATFERPKSCREPSQC